MAEHPPHYHSRYSDRHFAILLALLSALGPASIDTYLPSFPAIALTLGASQIEVQQTLTAYLLPFAVMTLWHGAIADALGRRRVILAALGLFGLSSLACMFVTSIQQLWMLRALQGITAGAGIVISRAIVRDLYDGPRAQRLMSNITIMFALAPAIAPVIGGWLETLFGWRSVFAFLTLFTSALGLACWRSLPETLPVARRQSLRPGYLARTYWKVLTHPPFLLACAALSFNFGGFFIYVLSAPVFVMQHLGASETGFLWLFGPAMGGLMGGAWISGRLAGKVSPGRTIAYGYLLMGCAVLLNFSLAAVFGQGLPWSVAHLFIYTLGMSLAMPCLTLFALDPFPDQRGLAASCQTFLQSCFNALAAGLIAPALWASARGLGWGMAVFLVLGALASLGYRWHQQRRGTPA